MPPFVVWIVKNILPGVAWLISVFIPGRKSAVVLREAHNKAEIMSLVNHVESVFPPPGTYVPLPKLVDQCYAMGDFPALWAVEGLGNYYAETFRERKLAATTVLTDPQLAGSLPSKSLTMLHAGIGLSFGKRSLEGLKDTSPPADIRAAIEKFINLCRANSQPGYAGCAFESLGLVTLILHNPAMALVVDRHLAGMDPTVATFMWRGAGRALFFHPKNFIPAWSSPWRGIAMCSEIAPSESARKNMRAGFSWALTVVNMRHPIIMEQLLLTQGRDFADRDAFINGVMSSMTMRYDTSPEDPYISRFIEHQPQHSNPLLSELWESEIRKPCQQVIREIHPVLKQHKRLDEVFHFQSLPDLVAKLKGGSAASSHHMYV